MQKNLFLAVTLFCIALSGLAQEVELPTLRVLPEDIVQDNIQQIQSGTNGFVVRWTYTEAGAQKMVAFWGSHVGQKTRTIFGDFAMPPALYSNAVNPEFIAKWLKIRSDRTFVNSKQEADRIEAGLKSKLSGLAQEAELPTLCVLPEDIVQDSIRPCRLGTNAFGVEWTYTEAGARKMVAFWEDHVGQKTRTIFGDFAMPPVQHGNPVNPEFKVAWLKTRTDKTFVNTRQEADRIEAGLKSKK